MSSQRPREHAQDLHGSVPGEDPELKGEVGGAPSLTQMLPPIDKRLEIKI